MTEIQEQILVILGAPNSGFTLLADCLGLLGVVNLATAVNAAINPPSSINRLLLQDLECDPGTIGNLPEGWTETAAATAARTRIEALLTQSAETNTLRLIADPTLSRLLPLWLAAFRDHAIEPRFVHLVRHPWETARSLTQTEGVDPFQGHLLWLASHRAALAGSTGQVRTLITFDQLLANPVSTLTAISQALEIHYPIRLETAYARLLSLVQPGFRHHHAGNAPEEDKFRFASFVKIYNALRLIQAHRGLGLEGDHSSAPAPEDATLATAWESLGLPTSPEDTGAELADLLFTALGVQERRAHHTARMPSPNLARRPGAGAPLLTTFHFPEADGATHPETIALLADEWRHIALPVPQPEPLRKRPLHFTPLNHTGTVWIAALKLVNQANGEVLWAAQTPQDFDALELGGTVLRAPGLENLVLLVTGNDPCVSLPILEKLPDCPILFEAWMRVSSKQIQSHEAAFAQTVMKGYLKQPQPQLLSSYLKESGHEFHEESFVDSIMEGKTNFDQTEKFRLLRELGEYQITQKNNLRALHYFTLARTFDPDDSKELFLLAQNYFKLNQKALALEVYLDFWLKWITVDAKAGVELKKLLRSYQEKAEVAKEHGQQLLIHYINENLDFIRSRTSHKLTLIEVGSTREDAPGQGSTRKLAQLCQKHQLHFITVDMDPRNTNYANNILKKINPSFEAITNKGEDFLKDYTGPIDFVFLDAYDFEHGKHSEERQSRYEQFLGDRINDQACHQMHLECAQHLLNKLSPYGAICIDDSWFINNAWAGKGTTAVPFLLQNNFNIVLSGNRSVLMVRSAVPGKQTSCDQENNKRTPEKIENLTIGSVRLAIDPSDKGGLHYKGRQHVEETLSPIYRLLREWLAPDIVIDIGANYGFTGSVFAKELKPKRLVVVEPDPRLLPFLKVNTEKNVPSEVETKVLGCLIGSDNRPDATLGLNPHGSQDNRVHPEGNWPLCTVQQKTLESILDEYVAGAPAFIKIDTQGYDPVVIASGSDYLAIHNNWFIKSEFAPHWIRSQHIDPVIFLMEMAAQYKVYESPARASYLGTLASLFSHPIPPDIGLVRDFVAYVESLNHERKGWVDIFIMPKEPHPSPFQSYNQKTP